MKRKIGVMEPNNVPCIEGNNSKDSKHSIQNPKPHQHVHVGTSLRR